MKVVECKDKSTWDAYVASHDGHPLQLWGWGEVKALHGWSVRRYFVYDNDTVVLGSQVLVRSLPWPFRSIAYIPRGPMPLESNTFHVKHGALSTLTFHVKHSIRPVLLKIEPDLTSTKLGKNWRVSKQTIQAPSTIQLNLQLSEDELLANMAKKTRQYIRKSSNDVAVVELDPENDLEECLAIYEETSARAHFPLHEKSYYQSVAKELGESSKLYGAKVGDTLVAFLWLAASKHTAFELYGGVTSTGQDLRANYVLKWHAIRRMKLDSVKVYDFGGLIDTGVSTFKKGWSDSDITLIGAVDFPMSVWYQVWAKAFPVAKRMIRFVRKQ